MRVQALAPLALVLRDHLKADAFAKLGRVELSDGATVDAERMARIILADVDRLARDDPHRWLTEREEQDLHDDLVRLLALVAEPAHA